MNDDGKPDNIIFSWHLHLGGKAGPHEVRKDPTGKVVVILQRQGRYGHFAINLEVLNSVAAAVQAGRLLKAYVAQVEWQKVLRIVEVGTVANNIRAVTPRDGPFGPYHWVDENFMPVVGSNRGANNEEPW
jgi:hypothetical protein